jgi:UDP-N-acetylglucosamine 1-carboxyvinyltransferase
MSRFVIRGGRALSGVYRAPGNKNAALPMLAACLLTSEPVVLRNLPLIQDVFSMLELLADLGVDVQLRGHTVTLHAARVRKRKLNKDLCGRVRTSILFAGPLAARYGQATLFAPGGDVIGQRRLDTHFDALRKLGIHMQGRQPYRFRCRRLRGARILLDEASVTATENAVMAAVLAEGSTSIFNAACEPHVQDLCRLLNKMGAQIRNIGTNYLRIRGVEQLSGVRHTIMPDYIDAASILAAGLLTGGAVEIRNVPEDQFDVLERPFRKLGARWTLDHGVLRLPGSQRLRVRNDFGAAIPKLEDGPWPNLPSDLMSIALVMATQASGSVLFFEKMFESRMYFVDRLIAMGARIVQCDPHRVVVSGPARLHGIHMASPDIRAGIALVLAALCAKGESVIDNAQSIDRGYERLDQKLRALGAVISRS